MAYTSENRALCVLEVLVHLTDILPDKYALGQADIPTDATREWVDDFSLPLSWKTLSVSVQSFTRKIGADWISRRNSAVLFVPSVVVDEKNILLNPEHPDFRPITLLDPRPFVFDHRLAEKASRTA